MKLKKYFSILVASAALISVSSCKQDLDQDPEFNYPADEGLDIKLPEPLYHAEFEDNLNLEGQLGGKMTTYGGMSPLFVNAKREGKAYQNQEGTALIIQPDASAIERLKNLGSFSVFMWVNYKGMNPSSCSLFAIGESKNFVGNFSFWIDDHHAKDDPKEFNFKCYLCATGNPGRPDSWFDVGKDGHIPNMANKWRMVGVTYDDTTTTMTLYNQGKEVVSKSLNAKLNPFTFDEVTGISLGAQPAMVGLSDVDSWPAHATFFTGVMDKFYFFGEALDANQVAALYDRTK